TDHHAQDDEWWFSSVKQAVDNGEGRAYLARTESIRQREDGLQARGMRDFLDVIKGNLQRFPCIGTKLLDFLFDRLQVRFLFIEQDLEGFRGNTVTTLDDCMGHPVV